MTYLRKEKENVFSLKKGFMDDYNHLVSHISVYHTSYPENKIWQKTTLT
jgi:hypothetical protein